MSADEPTSKDADDSFARALRGFGPIGILAILVIVFAGNDWILPIGAVLALAWAWRSHTPWRDLGFVRPKSWALTILGGIFFGIALKFFTKAVVLPLLGAPPANQTYHYLVGNTAALPSMIWTVTVAAGFGEETVFRGFLFERLGKLFGASWQAKAAIVLLVSALFASAHYSGQGIPGVEQAAFTGIVLGTAYALTGQLWLVIIAHAAFDLTALAMIYWNLEPAVSHLIFK